MVSIKSQAGVSLIEILLAMTIGVFLLAGVIHVLSGQRANYTSQDTQSRQQENLRYTVNKLTEQLREAGYGTSSCTGLKTAIDTPDVDTLPKHVNGTEAITIRWYTDEFGDPDEEWDDFNANCKSLTEVIYYIRSPNAAGENTPSLYRKKDGGNATEIVEGIENLRFEYGIDTNNDTFPNRYVTARSITGTNNNTWDNVVTVRFWVTARTMESINGSFYPQTVVNTVLLRNRS